MTTYSGWLSLVWAVFYGLACVISFVFFVLYATLVRWWEREESTHLLAFDGVIMLALLQTMLRFFFGVYPGFAFVVTFIVVAILVVVTWRLVIFIRLYRRGHANRRARRTE